MGMLPLQLLTVFPFTGLAGLNWFAVGQPITGILKVMTFGAGLLYGVLFQKLFPSLLSRGASLAMSAGPWYIFDSLQVLFDPAFRDNGFQSPIPIEGLPVGGGVDGKWTLTFPLIGMILATLAASGIAIAQYLPSDLVPPETKKYLDYASTGGGILLGGLGLIGAFMMAKPTTAAAVRGEGASASTFLASLAPVVPAATAPQTGGAKKLPPLSTFVEDLLDRSDANPKDTFQALTFLGILLIVAVGGLIVQLV